MAMAMASQEWLGMAIELRQIGMEGIDGGEWRVVVL